MAMNIEHPETGEEMEVFTKDDFAKIEEEAAAAKAEIERLQQVNAEKTENFRNLRDMTDDEKSAFDANQTELMRRDEMNEKKIAELEDKIANKEQLETQSRMDSELEKFHGGNEELKGLLEGHYNSIIPKEGATMKDIERRAELAARMAGVELSNAVNPLTQDYSGLAPTTSTPDNNPKQNEAMELINQRMGFVDPNAQQ